MNCKHTRLRKKYVEKSNKKNFNMLFDSGCEFIFAVRWHSYIFLQQSKLEF